MAAKGKFAGVAEGKVVSVTREFGANVVGVFRGIYEEDVVRAHIEQGDETVHVPVVDVKEVKTIA